MMQQGDLLFYLDGILGQVAIGKHYYESQGMTSLPLDGVAASVMTLRELVEAQGPTVNDETGECTHPDGAIKKTLVGGGNYVLVCGACQEIVEQSGDATE